MNETKIMQGCCRHVELGLAGRWGLVLVGFTLRDEVGKERKIGADIGDRKL